MCRRVRLALAAVLSATCAVAGMSAGAPAFRHADASHPVRTESGLVAGVTTADGQVRVFKGIPYAAPPVGNLRWRPPQPPSSWTGVRSAAEFGPACPQAERTGGLGEHLARTGEDCLYLNVWTPARPARRHVPVMVWIHGGGFTQGAGSLGVYDGEALARRGAVVVTFNYRLGPLGFLAHPLLTKESGHDASGNYGLLDQVAALRWVRANIREFGGSPDRVTVFGGSAGAISIGCLLVAPQARGLFRSVILESGSPFGVTRYLKDAPAGEESMEEVGELIARRLGCDRQRDVLAALRSRSAEDIVDAAHATSVFFGEGVRFGPIVDRWLVPDLPAKLFAAKKQHKVPMIVGANADEGAAFIARLQGVDVEGYRRLVRGMFRDRADEVLARFPVSRDADVRQALTRIAGGAVFAAPARRLARATADIGERAYLYSFSHVRSGTGAGRAGALHGSEVPFVFGTLFRLPRGAGGAEPDDADRDLSRTMMSYWVRFAATGDPNGEGMPQWPRYNRVGDVSIDLDDGVTERIGASRDLCDFFDRIAGERPPRRPAPQR